jgi:hypothetical protein
MQGSVGSREKPAVQCIIEHPANWFRSHAARSKIARSERTKIMKRRQNSTNPTLSPQQQSVITAIVQGQSISEATQKASVNRTTYYVWLDNPHFAAELNQARSERAQFIKAQLEGLADTAMAVLKDFLTSDIVPPTVRLKAAVTVLQGMGGLTPTAIGSTDPEQIRNLQSLNLIAFP